jgi:mutator protein MutT
LQREYPNHPRAAVGVVVVRNSRVLLVRRGQEPSKGLWSVPGGLIELGETIEEAARREVMEEAGIRVRIERLLDVADNIVRDDQGKTRFHYVLVDYVAHPVTTSLKASSDASEARWVHLEDLRNYPLTRGALKLMRKIGEPRANTRDRRRRPQTKSTQRLRR